MLGTECFCRQSGVWSLVGNFATGETNGETANLLVGPFYRKAEHPCRIHSTAQKNADRYVCDHMKLNCLGQEAQQIGSCVLKTLVPERLHEAKIPVLLDHRLAIFDQE